MEICSQLTLGRPDRAEVTMPFLSGNFFFATIRYTPNIYSLYLCLSSLLSLLAERADRTCSILTRFPPVFCNNVVLVLVLGSLLPLLAPVYTNQKNAINKMAYFHSEI